MMRRLIIGAITLGLCLLGHRSGAENVSAPNGYTLLRAVRTKAEGVNAGQIRAYIDTGYVPTSLELGFDFDFAYHSALSVSSKRIMGAGGQSNGKWSGVFLSGTTIAGTEGGGTFYFGKMSHPLNPELKQNERMLLRVRNHELKTSAGLAAALAATECNFDGSSILLGRNGTALSETVSTSANLTIYGFKIYEGERLVANFIPVRRDSDGEIGLLDIVGSLGFRGNAGEGELAAIELTDAPPMLAITSSLGDGVAAQLGEVFPGYGVEAGLQAGEKIAIGLLIGEATDSFCSGWKLYHQEGENWVLDQVGSGPLEYVQGSVPTKLEWQWHQLVLNGFEAIKNGGIESGTWIKNDGAYGNNNGTDAFTEDWTGGRISKAGGGFSVPDELVKGTYCMIAQGNVTLSQKISIPAAGAGVLSFSCARRGGTYNPNTSHYLTVSLGGQVVVDNASIIGANVQQKSFDLGQVPAGETTLEFVFSQSSGDLATFLEDISLKVTSKESSDEGTFIISSSVDGERGAPQPAYGSYSGFAAGDPLSARMENPVVTNGIEVLSCVGWRLYGYDRMTDGWELRSEGAGTAFAGVFAYPRMKLEWVWLKWLSENPLPEGYTLLEYVGSTGSQYLDTGIVPKSTTRLCVDFQYTNIPTPITGDGFRNGWGSSASQEAFEFGILSNGKFFEVVKDKTDYAELSAADKNRHTLDLASGAQYFDGELKSETSIGDTATSVQTMYLFALHGEWYNTAGNVNAYSSERIFSCQIWDGTKLVRDYVPAMDNNGTIGFYDLVAKSLKPPESGTLDAGPPKEPPCAGEPGTVAIEGVPNAYAQVYPGYGIYEMPTEAIVCAAPEAPTDLGAVVRCRGYRLFELNGKEWAEVASGEENSFTLMPSEKPMRLEWLWEAHTETYHATIAGVQKLSEIAWLDVNNQRVSWETVRLSAAELQLSMTGENPRLVFDAAISFENLVLSGSTTLGLVYSVTPNRYGNIQCNSGATYEFIYPVENTDVWGGDLALAVEVDEKCKAIVLAGASAGEASVWSGTITTTVLLALEGKVALDSPENDLQGGLEVRAGAQAQVRFKDQTFKGKLSLKENSRFAALDEVLVLPFSNDLNKPALELRSGAEIFGAGKLLAPIPTGVSVSKRFCVSVIRAGSSEEPAVITAPILLAGSDNADLAKHSTLALSVNPGAKLTLRGAINQMENAQNVGGVEKIGDGHLNLADGFALDASLAMTISKGSFGVSSPLTLAALKWNAAATYLSQDILTVNGLTFEGSGSFTLDMADFVAAKPWSKRFFVLDSPALTAAGALDRFVLENLPEGEWEKVLRGTLLTVTLPDLDTDWTGGGGDFAWTNALNWTKGVPKDGMYVTIGGITAPNSLALPEGMTDYLAELTLTGDALRFEGGILQVDSLFFDDLGSLVFAGEELRVSRSLEGAELELADASMLVISNDIPITVATAIVGGGRLTKEGIGTLTLAGENAYRGGFAALSGLTVAAAEGAITGAVTVAQGASVDANEFGGIDTLYLKGAGDENRRPWAFTSSAGMTSAVRRVVLEGDATIGSATNLLFGGEGSLLELSDYTLTKVGEGEFCGEALAVTGGVFVVAEGVARFVGEGCFNAAADNATKLVVAAGAMVKSECTEGGESSPLWVSAIDNSGRVMGALGVRARLEIRGEFAALTLADGARLIAHNGAEMTATSVVVGDYQLDVSKFDFSGSQEGDAWRLMALSEEIALPSELIFDALAQPPVEVYCAENLDGGYDFGVRRKVLDRELYWDGTNGVWSLHGFNGEELVFDNSSQQSVYFRDCTVSADRLEITVEGEKQVNELIFENTVREVVLAGDAIAAKTLKKQGYARAVVAAAVELPPAGKIELNKGELAFEVPVGETRNVAATIIGEGRIAVVGGGTLVLAGDNSFVGAVIAEVGTIRMGSHTAFGALGNSVSVMAGGEIDIYGQRDYESEADYQLVLAGGRLVDTSELGSVTNTCPFSTVTVKGEAEIGGATDIRIGYEGETISPLVFSDGSVLTKTGAGQLRLVNCLAMGAGRLAVNEGLVRVEREACDLSAVSLIVADKGNLRLDADLKVWELTLVGRSVQGEALVKVAHSLNVGDNVPVSIGRLELADGVTLSGNSLNVATELRLGESLDIAYGGVPQNGHKLATVPGNTKIDETHATINGRGRYRVYLKGNELRFFNPPTATYSNYEVGNNFQTVLIDVKVDGLSFGVTKKNTAQMRVVVVDERGAEISGAGYEISGTGSGHYNFSGLEYGHNYYVVTRLNFDDVEFTLDAVQIVKAANDARSEEWSTSSSEGKGAWIFENALTYTYRDFASASGRWVTDPKAVSVNGDWIVFDPSESESSEVLSSFTPTNTVIDHSGYELRFKFAADSAYENRDLPDPAQAAFGLAIARASADPEKLAFWVISGDLWREVPRARMVPHLGEEYELVVSSCLKGDSNGSRPVISYYLTDEEGTHFLFGAEITSKQFPDSLEFNGFMHLKELTGELLDDSVIKVALKFDSGEVIGQNFTNFQLSGKIDMQSLHLTDFTNGIAFVRVRDAKGETIFEEEIWLSDAHDFDLPFEVVPGGIYSVEVDVNTEERLRVTGDDDYRSLDLDARKALAGWIRENADTIDGTAISTGEWAADGDMDFARKFTVHAEPCIEVLGDHGRELRFTPTNNSAEVLYSTTREFRFQVYQHGGDTPYRFKADIEGRKGEELPEDLRLEDSLAGVTLVADDGSPTVVGGVTNYPTRFAIWDASVGEWKLVGDRVIWFGRFAVTNRIEAALGENYLVAVAVNYGNPTNRETGVAYSLINGDTRELLAGVSLPPEAMPQISEAYTNGVAYSGCGSVVALEGDVYDAHLAAVDGEEYWTIAEALAAIGDNPDKGFTPLWNATYEITDPSGRFSVNDPDGLLKVLWNGHFYETERIGDNVWYFYSPDDNWIGFADDMHLESNTWGYVVSDARALAYLARMATNEWLSCERIELATNINLSAHGWTPIAGFTGVFDGKTNAVVGLRNGDFRFGVTNAANISAYALFASASNAVFQNVAFERVAITNGADAVAALLGCSLGELMVSNVTIRSGTIRGDGTWTAGAVGLAEDYPELVLVASTNAAALVAGESVSYLAGLANLGGFTEYREGRGQVKIVDNENRGELQAQIAIGAGNVAQVAGGAKDGATFGEREIHGNVGMGAVGRVTCETSGYQGDLPPYPVVNLASVYARYGSYLESSGEFSFRRYIEAEGSSDATPFDLLVDPCYRTARLFGALTSNGETNLVGLVNDTIATLPDGGRFDLNFDIESWDPIELDRNLGFNLNGHLLDVVFENSAFAITREDIFATISNGTVIVNARVDEPLVMNGEENVNWRTNDVRLVKWGEDGTEYYNRDIYILDNDEPLNDVSMPMLMTYLKTGAAVSFTEDSIYSMDEEGNVKVAGQTVASFGKGYKVDVFTDDWGFPAYRVTMEPIKLGEAVTEVALDLSEVLKSVGEIGPQGKSVELTLAGNTLAACDYGLQSVASLAEKWPTEQETEWKSVAKDGESIRFTILLKAESGFFRIAIREKPERKISEP